MGVADCLVQWLQHAHTDRCELCGHTFQFQPVFQPDAPDSLSAREAFEEVWLVALLWAQRVLRVGFVAVCWVFAFPLCARYV